MDYDDYETWSENARLARAEYLQGKLTAEIFLQKIDTTHELKSYEAGKAELVEETPWQQRVAQRWDFDPEIFYPESMMVLDMTPGKKGEWEIRVCGINIRRINSRQGTTRFSLLPACIIHLLQDGQSRFIM